MMVFLLDLLGNLVLLQGTKVYYLWGSLVLLQGTKAHHLEAHLSGMLVAHQAL
ncbi:hypothetical protein CPB83DRAFT_862491 [Crepidotus variabilis]|uniref:Uncharacterized protein n=1 Tax=Crepidotus variabilis TaxID=179855 RepID=A0A9P6E727_9AGAR|nr:hypothetical protein CPB83DRAFT_862491 [Crepidotus variabilis]